MDYVLRTNALFKKYKEHNVLNGLSLNVPKGAIYGFIGRNGAGKTTLIRLICGLQKPTRGNFTLYNVNSNNPEILKMRRRTGAVVETPSIYLDMTAVDNLKQQYCILGLPSYDGLEDIIKLVNFEEAGKKKVRDFSLGMRQRLGIAISLVGSPDFLVLDEPINGLDPQGVIEIRELILKLNKEEQITIFLSSHILDELSKIATHYGFINDGRMVKEISDEELQAVLRKSLRMEVSDCKILARVLDSMEVDYNIISDNKADVFSKVNVTELVMKLDQEKCKVISILEHDEGLESYYIGLVGGYYK